MYNLWGKKKRKKKGGVGGGGEKKQKAKTPKLCISQGPQNASKSILWVVTGNGKVYII